MANVSCAARPPRLGQLAMSWSRMVNELGGDDSDDCSIANGRHLVLEGRRDEDGRDGEVRARAELVGHLPFVVVKLKRGTATFLKR